MVSLILAISSSLESAEVHSSLSFRIIKLSPISIGIGSVGTSETPKRVTICSISGNSSRRSCSILVEVASPSSRELPGFKMIWKAISPSSSCGINSPPILVNMNAAKANNAMAVPSTIFPLFKDLFNRGSYLF